MASEDAVLEELQKIRELLAKPPDPPKPKGMANEFKAFLSEYKVLGLAVAFILGLYLGSVVKALVTDIILPIVSYALPPGTDINTYMAGAVRRRRLCQCCADVHHRGVGDLLIVKVADRYKIA